jgi:hypothetical protein
MSESDCVNRRSARLIVTKALGDQSVARVWLCADGESLALEGGDIVLRFAPVTFRFSAVVKSCVLRRTVSPSATGRSIWTGCGPEQRVVSICWLMVGALLLGEASRLCSRICRAPTAFPSWCSSALVSAASRTRKEAAGNRFARIPSGIRLAITFLRSDQGLSRRSVGPFPAEDTQCRRAP